MNHMTTAGSPAIPRPDASLPRTVHHRLAKDDALATTTSGAADPLHEFLAEAARRRNRHTREEAGRPQDWADPDPSAIRLPILGHPVDLAAHRHRAGRSREDFLRQVRVACERLQNLEPRTLTPEDVRSFPWHHLEPEGAREYREAIYRRFRYQTSRNDAVSVVRRVVKQCYKAGLISAMRLDLVLDELYTVAPGPSSRRRRLSQSEINDLLAACERIGTPKAIARNAAIVALLRTSGMRIGELARILLVDWDRDGHAIMLRETKNGHDHVVYLHPDAVPYLERWLAIRGSEPGALFTPLTGTDMRSLTGETLRYMLRTRTAAAGVAPFGCHDFRRTFATELLRTHDVALVGKLLNHNKTESTLRYDLADEDEQRRAVTCIGLPTMPVATTVPDQHDGDDERRAGR